MSGGTKFGCPINLTYPPALPAAFHQLSVTIRSCPPELLPHHSLPTQQILTTPEMSGSRSITPTLDAEPRQSIGFPRTMTSQSRDTMVEEQAEQEAANSNEWKPAEGPGSRLPVPEKFAHTGESLGTVFEFTMLMRLQCLIRRLHTSERCIRRSC